MKAELDINKTVKKSNILNELRNANASLIEYRLFCVYLAHIPMNSDDNVVKFSLSDYAKIAGLDRPRYLDLKAQAENMVGMTATIENDDGGFSVYSLFSEFKLFKEEEQWMVSLECNDKIASKIREQKGRFLRYKLYNTIYLKSYNQQRIYELLKQYEKIGTRSIDLIDLRAYLSINDNEYPVWGVFSRDVLKVAQKALRENTDIYFEYEPIKKGRKVVAVRFDVYKNHSFIDQLHIDDFLPPAEIETSYEGEEIDVHATEDYNPDQLSLFDEMEVPEHLAILAQELPEFTIGKLELLYSLARDHVPTNMDDTLPRSIRISEYVLQKARLMDAQEEPVESRFGWLKRAVGEDWR